MKRLFSALALAAAFWAAACGGYGGTPITLPPPVGNFSNASLNGQYAFVTNGESFTGGFSPVPLSRVGTFIADGAGHITGGVEDTNAPGNVNLPAAITGGSYTVNADGRGFVTLQFSQASIDFGITLTSTNDGLLIDETSNASQSSTGSGNFIKQTGGPFAVSTVAGPYIFDFAGLDASGNPDSFVGQFDASNGVVSPGFFDENIGGSLSNGSFIGTLAADPVNPGFPIDSFGRGIAQIAGQNFVFYIVNGSRARFLSTTGGMISGDAVAQDNTIPTNTAALNSGFAFIVAGSSGDGGLIRVGRFTANGTAVTKVLMDTNNAGVFGETNSATNASIALDPAVPGRGTVTFKADNFSLPLSFVFYLSSATQGVLQETTSSLQGNAVAVADGTIAVQTGNPFSSANITGNYALNWSGLSNQQGGQFIDEEDLVGQAKVTNLNLAGAADIFQFTGLVPQFDLAVGGAITIGGDGTGGNGNRSTMGVKLTGATQIDFVVYFVNPRLAFFANNTNAGTTRTVAGILKAQN